MLSNADLVLTLGVKDLYFHLSKRDSGFFSRSSKLITRSDCQIIRVDIEGVSTNSWVTEYGRLTPVTTYIGARPTAAVSVLLNLCKKESSVDRKEKIMDRTSLLSEKSRELRKKWIETAFVSLKQRPLAYPALSFISWELVREKDWVLAFPGYSSRGINSWLRKIWSITKYHQYPGRGEGTGTGTGQAIGVALANRGRLCIDFQPDGDLLYSSSALWTAAHSKIPLLVVMLNNRSYHNDEEHNRFISEERGRSDESSRIGIKLEDPAIDFAKLAGSFGIRASSAVDDTDALRQELSKGISVVERGEPYLIDVLIQSDLRG